MLFLKSLQQFFFTGALLAILLKLMHRTIMDTLINASSNINNEQCICYRIC